MFQFTLRNTFAARRLPLASNFFLLSLCVLPHAAEIGISCRDRATFYIDIVSRSLFHSAAHTRTHDLDYLDDLIIMRDGVEEAGRPPETVCECGTVANSLLLIPASSELAFPPTAMNAIQSNGRSTLHYISSASMWFNKFISRSHSKLSKAIFTLLWSCVYKFGRKAIHISRRLLRFEVMIIFYDPQQTFNYIIAAAQRSERDVGVGA